MRLESNYIVGILLAEAYKLKFSICGEKGRPVNEALANDFYKITERLKGNIVVESLVRLIEKRVAWSIYQYQNLWKVFQRT
ncbi:hypothetical protein A9970_11420 [Sphingobacterium sp. UME9]|nr:hypothetical protein [Sphingobacterium sp. UME9]